MAQTAGSTSVGFNRKSDPPRLKELGGTIRLTAAFPDKKSDEHRPRAFIFNSEERAREAMRRKERAFCVKGIAQPGNAEVK